MTLQGNGEDCTIFFYLGNLGFGKVKVMHTGSGRVRLAFQYCDSCSLILPRILRDMSFPCQCKRISLLAKKWIDSCFKRIHNTFFWCTKVNELFLIKEESIKTLPVMKTMQKMEKTSTARESWGAKEGMDIAGISLDDSLGWSNHGGGILGHLLAGSWLPKSSSNAKLFMGNDLKGSVIALVKNCLFLT